MRAALVAALVCALGCVDFDLDERRFRCDGESAVCGSGWVCSAEGYCERGAAAADAGPEVCNNGRDDDGDEAVDCQDPDCGLSSCDDENPCTTDTCPLSGVCDNEPRGDGSMCGPGCSCTGDGTPIELACGDGADNDGDQLIDCSDTDCPDCAGELQCCADGGCRTSCE